MSEPPRHRKSSSAPGPRLPGQRPPEGSSRRSSRRKRSGSLHDDDSGRITLTFRAPSLHVPDLDAPVLPLPPPPEPAVRIETPLADLDAPTERVERGEAPGEPALALELDGESFASAPPLEVSDGWAQARPAPPRGARRPASYPPKRASQQDMALDPASSRRGADALQLVERVEPLPSIDIEPPNLVTEMEERFALGDFTGSLATAELILGADPGHELARRYVETCKETLERLYCARIGDMRSVPSVAVPTVELRWLGLDHRAGFLLSLIDGHTRVDELLDVSGMSRLEATRILAGLIEAGVVRMSEPG
ncbi:MAG: hypothetical protein IT379_05015 [Deltaproteobacteria bacterium]|nr:hypothetical protein [Deltaproteobacteria bacterium]